MVDQKETLEILRFSGENLLTIINDILDFSKIESEKITLESVDFDLFKLVLNTKRMLEHRTREKNIDLVFNYDENYRELYRVIPLAQVITNLAGNAIKFTAGGTLN
jgi:signal transduction histidine kinase